MRTCKGPCGLSLPLDQFRQRKRPMESRGVQSDGGYRLEIAGKCKKCQRRHESEGRPSQAKPEVPHGTIARLKHYATPEQWAFLHK